jgi:hypothetical protein
MRADADVFVRNDSGKTTRLACLLGNVSVYTGLSTSGVDVSGDASSREL